MTESPHIEPHLAWRSGRDGAVYVVSEDDVLVFRGRVYAPLLSLLDGRRTIGEVIAMLSGEVSAPEVHFALARLAEHGCLSGSKDEGQPEREAAYWRLHGVDPRTASARIAAAAVRVEGVPGPEMDAACRALSSAGLQTAPHHATVALVVACDYLDPELIRIEAGLRAAGLPWLLVRPFGTRPWIGPLLVPGVDACLECLASRLRGHRALQAFVASQLGDSLPREIPVAALSCTVEMALRLAAVELARWIAGVPAPTIQSTLLSFDLRLLEIQRHQVVRRPQCPGCGVPDLVASRGWSPVRLASRTRNRTLDNGYRDRDPEVTFRGLAHHVSPITGVVSELRPVPGPGDETIRAFFSGSNVAMPVRDLETLEQRVAAVSGGKGLTEAQARASALCEALERYSATFQGDEPRIAASLLELGEQAIHPNALQGLSARQLREREQHNAEQADRRRWIPQPFDERARVEWTPLWSLANGSLRYLPTSCCYLGYPGPGLPSGDSNGVAAGNTLEEAILQGFLELVERDGVAIWWYNRLRRPGVDLAGFGEPRFDLIRESHARLGRSLWLLDLTTDLELPVYGAVSMEEATGAHPRVVLGFGAHLEARVAAGRAMTEVNQALRMSQAGRGDGFWHGSDLTEHAFLFPDRTSPMLQPVEPSTSSDDLKENVRCCIARAETLGLETFLLDLTRPDIGLPVVRVAVPGLRHFWPRFAPGRLFDVPVRIGWLKEPLREEDLNPLPTLF